MTNAALEQFNVRQVGDAVIVSYKRRPGPNDWQNAYRRGELAIPAEEFVANPKQAWRKYAKIRELATPGSYAANAALRRRRLEALAAAAADQGFTRAGELRRQLFLHATRYGHEDAACPEETDGWYYSVPRTETELMVVSDDCQISIKPIIVTGAMRGLDGVTYLHYEGNNDWGIGLWDDAMYAVRLTIQPKANETSSAG